jgi:NAD+ kinase
MSHFTTVGLIGHLNNERAVYSIKRLIKFLQQAQKNIVLETQTAALITDPQLLKYVLQTVDIDSLGQICDLVIVIGGDGSLLRGARARLLSSTTSGC